MAAFPCNHQLMLSLADLVKALVMVLELFGSYMTSAFTKSIG